MSGIRNAAHFKLEVLKMNLTLSSKEAAYLSQALRTYLGDIRIEISRTDDLRFRVSLQEELDCLKVVDERLNSLVHHLPGEAEEKKAG
jgi:hypothetical protein